MPSRPARLRCATPHSTDNRRQAPKAAVPTRARARAAKSLVANVALELVPCCLRVRHVPRGRIEPLRTVEIHAPGGSDGLVSSLEEQRDQDDQRADGEQEQSESEGRARHRWTLAGRPAWVTQPPAGRVVAGARPGEDGAVGKKPRSVAHSPGQATRKVVMAPEGVESSTNASRGAAILRRWRRCTTRWRRGCSRSRCT
jgi:hypothetical protein